MKEFETTQRSAGWIPRGQEDRVYLRRILQERVSVRVSHIAHLPVAGAYDSASIAEDVIQHKLQPENWKALRRFKGRCSLKRYLGRIVDNYLCDLFRSGSVCQDFRTVSIERPIGTQASSEQLKLIDVLYDITQPTAYELVAGREDARIIMHEIARLRNATHRRIVELSAEGLKPTEIADALDITSNTVSVFLCRFRKHMSHILNGR